MTNGGQSIITVQETSQHVYFLSNFGKFSRITIIYRKTVIFIEIIL